MAILKTFDLKGNKLSFANWISNLSPAETPFTSMIKKEAVDQTMYSWQVDRLAAPANISIHEGSDFVSPLLAPTQVKSNFTQILRKVVRITDTANKVGLYGRASEKAYQMEKAAKELRRDLEKAVLTQVDSAAGGKAAPRRFAGFAGLVAPEGLPCGDTGAVVHKVFKSAAGAPLVTKEVLFDLTYNLYLAGAKANKIMVHPKHMIFFAGLMNGATGGSFRMFDNVDTKFNMYVNKVRDPLGQEFTIIPNRFMPEDKFFFFNEADWSQMILREPKTEELARNGSSEKHMIEMEVGLRHRNPYASGVLVLKDNSAADVIDVNVSFVHPVTTVGHAAKMIVTVMKNGKPDTGAEVAKLTVNYSGATGITNTPLTTTGDGRFGSDVTATKSGFFTVEVIHDGGITGSAELLVHSADTRAVVLEEGEELVAPAAVEVEVKAAPKAKKAK